jgi:DNA excision repair protein ERCC-2
MTEYRVGVRELAEFCYRSGDIDFRFTPSPTGAEGVAGHQRVVDGRPEGYLGEYPLEQTFERDDMRLCVSGRADGYDPQAGYIEEIKTCRVDANTIPAGVADLHRAQARLYGALLLQAEPARECIELRVTWYNIDTTQQVSSAETLSRESLDSFLEETLQHYGQWLRQVNSRRVERDEGAARLGFPYPGYRAGQRQMAETVYKCIASGGRLLLEAPTGIGKTAAVLYPAVKALASDRHDAVVFVTARTVGRRAAEETLARFERDGLRLRSLSLTARETVCFSPGRACHGDDCPFARGYYDKLPAAREAALSRCALRREEIEEVARQFEVCPYQLASDLAPWVDLVICDVHYVYSFFANLAGLLDGGGRRWSVLLDEAHNLPDRARGMYSAALSKRRLMDARAQGAGPVRRALDVCNRVCLELQKQDWEEENYHLAAAAPTPLGQALMRFSGAVGEELGMAADYLQQRPALLDFYFDALQFLRVLEVAESDYCFEMERGRDRQSLQLRLACLDPARLLRERQAAPLSVTAFSATASPPQWLASGLGFPDEHVFLSLPSPFKPEQLVVSVDAHLDTRFRARQRTLGQLARSLRRWLDAVPGNCILYFPSYRYLQDTLDELEGTVVNRTVLVQRREATEAERAELLATLEQRDDVAAFCILGGVFGEGIDLPGDALSSVVIVGVGLPQFSRLQEARSEYYGGRQGGGFEFAYLYPGMQKVCQALGRVVRGDSDYGRALLLDTRYGQPGWRSLLPPWWRYESIGGGDG